MASGHEGGGDDIDEAAVEHEHDDEVGRRQDRGDNFPARHVGHVKAFSCSSVLTSNSYFKTGMANTMFTWAGTAFTQLDIEIRVHNCGILCFLALSCVTLIACVNDAR